MNPWMSPSVMQRVSIGTAGRGVPVLAGVPLWPGFEELREVWKVGVGRVGVPPDKHLGLSFHSISRGLVLIRGAVSADGGRRGGDLRGCSPQQTFSLGYPHWPATVRSLVS